MSDEVFRQRWSFTLNGTSPIIIAAREVEQYPKPGRVVVGYINDGIGSRANVCVPDNGIGPPEEEFLVPRSGHWSTVRKHFLEKFPTCAACGGMINLEAHHVKSFHEHPDLELDPSNLITLCQAPGLSHHLNIGHLGNWKLICPTVREDAAAFLAKVKAAKVKLLAG